MAPWQEDNTEMPLLDAGTASYVPMMRYPIYMPGVALSALQLVMMLPTLAVS